MADFTKLNGYTVKDPQAVHTYDTVADLKADTKLKAGNHVKTKGYYSANDGGSAEYIIDSNQNEHYESLNNGLYANLIIEYPLNVKKFGAYGDNEHDDTTVFQKVFNISATNGGDIFLPTGKYKITSPITVNWGQNLPNRRPKVQKIYGGGSQSFEIDYDNTVIVGYNIPAFRGIIELLGSGNSWSTHTVITDLSIVQDKTTCDPNSFCLFYGDANQFELNKVKMLGYNDVYVRCGSNHSNGGSGYAGINTRYINSKFAIFEDYSKGFSILPERIVTGTGSPMDNLLIESCAFGGVAVLECIMLKIESSHIALRMQVKDKTTSNVGALNGFEIDYSTGILLTSFMVAKISELYCEDYRRAIDVLPLTGIMGNLTIDSCYFNARSNQTYNNQPLLADYGIITRANTNQSTWVIKNMVVSNCLFRQRAGSSDVFNFNEYPIENNIAQQFESINNVNFDKFDELSINNPKNGFHIKPIGFDRIQKNYDVYIDSIAQNETFFKFENDVESIVASFNCYLTGVELYFDTAPLDTEDFVVIVNVNGTSLSSISKDQLTYSQDKKYFGIDKLVGTRKIEKGSIIKFSIYSTNFTSSGSIGKSVKAKITLNN